MLVATVHARALKLLGRRTPVPTIFFRSLHSTAATWGDVGAEHSPLAAELPTTNEGWRAVLSPPQFAVLRNRGTEPPGYSEATPGALEYELQQTGGSKLPREGTFSCAGCAQPLYTAASKFDSACGWPAFYEGLPGAIRECPDADGRRVEIVCSRCDGHLGHVFKGEGFDTPTNARHCVNGISLKYDPVGAKL